ncbi:MAG: hypothetical protein EON54_03615 [Alcaligenaceae bacterium]|nr:MAG: hypothetical protein EON54_03615 [Alcaligenaceae bacterium]
MFNKITLGNFKRFQNESVELRRLNIIVGPNNSGKSSLLSAFRLICQTLDSFDDQVPLLLNGPLGDFGTYRDLVYKNHRGRPIELAFDIALSGLKPTATPDTQSNLSVSLVFKYSQEDREIFAQSISIKCDGSPLIDLKYSLEGRRHEFRIVHFIPAPVSFGRLGMFNKNKVESAYAQFVETFNSGPDSEVIRILARISHRLPNFMGKVDYLGPLRTPPSRTYLFSGERSKRIGIGGENLTSLLATKDRKKSREKGDEQSSRLHDRINTWLQQSEMAHSASLASISDRHFEIRVKNFFTKEDQNIADVGYGHSQVLPFLAGGYALGPKSVYIAEQPELHLHPRAQAELGDFLLQMYEQETQVLVETHSEHLILRLQQHIARGAIPHDEVRVFYVCNDRHKNDDLANGSNHEIIPIDFDTAGQFTRPWPRGFFPEKLEESKKLARARMSQLNLKL